MDSVYLTNKFTHIFLFFLYQILVSCISQVMFFKDLAHFTKNFQISNTGSYLISLHVGKIYNDIPPFVTGAVNVFPLFS